MRTPISVGVIGEYHSTDVLARSFHDLPQAELRWLCGLDSTPPFQLTARYPSAHISTSVDDLLNDESLDAIAIATPPSTHYELAKRAIEADKHVFLEPPLALCSDHGEELLRTARRVNRRLIVADRLRFDPALVRLRRLMTEGYLGEIYYLTLSRAVAPQNRSTEDILWGVGARELSTLLHAVGDEPVEAVAIGDSYLHPEENDVVFCHLRFATGITGRIDLSRLEQQERYRLSVVGAQRTVVVDYRETEHRFTIHEARPRDRWNPDWLRESDQDNGEIVSVLLPDCDPIPRACAAFLASIHSTAADSSSETQAAISVVGVLEALELSLRERGSLVRVASTPEPVSRVTRLGSA